MQQYCYVTGTYVKRYTGNEDNGRPIVERMYVDYYQWVPFLFILQAIIIYFPHFVWRYGQHKGGWLSGQNTKLKVYSLFQTLTLPMCTRSVRKSEVTMRPSERRMWTRLPTTSTRFVKLRFLGKLEVLKSSDFLKNFRF